MITDTLSNGLKDLFAALGAKTSDSNYAVPLLNKTNGTPQGMMDMASLASVLGDQQSKFTCEKHNMAVGASKSIGNADYIFIGWSISWAHLVCAVEGNSIAEIYSSTNKPQIGVSVSNGVVTLTNNYSGAISAYVWILRRPS